MDFVARLEDFLRDLGAESRKKHPGVKEASERAILRLRTLQNAYASAVRKAASSGAEHPTTSLFQSQDLLHPFLLAANYPNASTKLLDISFKAMRLLMESNAVCPGDGIHMVRVWTIQAHVIMSQYQKTNKSTNKHSSDTATANNSNTTGSASTINNAGSGGSKSTVTSLASSTASWFGMGGLIGGGGGGGSSSDSSGAASSTDASNASNNGSSSAVEVASKTIINAVSSSSGQSGQYNVPSNKDMEKIALEILSCLLKLTELMKNETQSTDMWTQSVSLCCLLLDFRKTVQQAAHSTLPQVLVILYQTSDNNKFNLQTWEDLLLLASYGPNKKAPTLSGAFSQCRLDAASIKAPPPPNSEFALELMATILQEKPDILASSDKFLTRTMGVTVALLQQITIKSFNLTKALRVYQWTLVVLQTQAAAVNECRELLQHVTKPIRGATEACRTNKAFEDGFAFVGDSSSEPSLGAMALPSKSITRRISSADKANAEHPNAKQYTPLLSSAKLWKAGLAIETLYLLLSHCTQLHNDDDASGKDLFRLLDRQTIVIISETVSDFAIVGAGCQGHIMQLVDVFDRIGNNSQDNTNGGEGSNSDRLLRRLTSEDDKHSQSQNDNKFMLFHRAEQLIKSGAVATIFDDKGAGKTATNDKKQSSVVSQDAPVMGETLWVAFHSMLEIPTSILPNSSQDMRESLVEGAFAPSLATLQHYLKRVPGSPDLTRQSLKGYTHLAELCMPAAIPEQLLQRKAVLSSLCKLSLPSWGERKASSLLHNHHVRSLICLLRIVHTHYNRIDSEWNVVMLTFEELSVMTISSPQMSDQIYHAALAISACFGRFAPFSTCFSNEGLHEFIEAVAIVSSSATRERKLVTSNNNAVLDRVLVSSDPSTLGEKGAEEGKASIGGKLVSIGVRAILGSSSGEGAEHDNLDDVPIAKRTKSTFYEAYRNEFVGRLETTTTTSLQPGLAAMLPFGLALLADVAIANSFRYKKCMPPISTHICSFASVAPALRTYVLDTAAMLILFKINNAKNDVSFKAPARLVYVEPKQHQLLAVEPTVTSENEDAVEGSGDDIMSHAELFAPICNSICTFESAPVAEAATTILLSVLENIGHTLSGEVWIVIVSAVASLSGDVAERSSAEWSNCCVLGFRCLKLIVDDFLDNLPPPSSGSATALGSLLDCCASFGRSRHDVNTSLTAIGLLWTIADKDAGPDALDFALSKLVELASDGRPEVRNCSVNTLFSCIVGRGNTFSASQWQACICDTVFGVCGAVVLKVSDSGDGKVDLDGNAVEGSRARYKVNVHHSRDSAGKQWVMTQSLALHGLSRVLRSFFSLLLDHSDDASIASGASQLHSEGEDDSVTYDEEETEDDEEDETDGTDEVDIVGSEAKPWLVGAWSRILDFALQAAAQVGERDSLDLRLAGAELLVLCAQLSCKAGIQAAITPARVGTNMQVVNGALRDVGPANSPKPAKATQRTHSIATDEYRHAMFCSAMEKADAYREFIETSEKEKDGAPSEMEATQVQVLQKFVGCLSNLYDCCKNNEMAHQGDLGDKLAIKRCFQEFEIEGLGLSFEYRFVRLLATVTEAASGGPRFLSQAQRASIELLRSMAKRGSSEALLQIVRIAGPWIFCRKDEGGNATSLDPAGAALVSCEMASLLGEEVSTESISHGCKALALWISLSSLSPDIFNSERGSEGRRKAYYQHFLPLLHEGLKSSLALVADKVLPAHAELELLLVADIWKRLCEAQTRMLTPVPDAADLLKISRAPEVLDMLKLSIDFVPDSARDNLCAVLSEGAFEALAVEKASRPLSNEDAEGEMGRRRKKYHDDALSVFKKCYAGLCIKKVDDPALLAITDKAFTDALATLSVSKDGPTEDLSVDLFLMVCQAFEENPGLEGLIISSFPLLCKLVQTSHDDVRNAAAAALGSADLRQVISDARVRYEVAERRAERAEQEAKDLANALADLQAKNDLSQGR